ncbi:MAG: DNA cytosine methyltransferase [Deltaproteobacteria bacterium]|jgi:DNA (cytosine-5)-methyltransferase 1|nr:DNA cytosine methyltransferase [Deltaproteobacteria bacterium]
MRTGDSSHEAAAAPPDPAGRAAPWDMHEFFAGSGLVGLGLAGMFRPVWANDSCPRKAAVYRANAGAGHFRLGDVRGVRGRDLPPAHLSWASFPCQDLSLAGPMGGIEAARSGLVWEWLRVLGEIREARGPSGAPAVLVTENVHGLLSAGKGAHYRKLHSALAEAGYRSGAVVVDAARFLPQSRPRVFVIAVREGVALPPGLVSGGPCWLHSRAAAALGAELPGWIWWSAPEPGESPPRLEDLLDLSLPCDRTDVLSLVPPRHRAALDSLGDAVATGYRRVREGGQRLELRFDGLAGCLRTPDGGSSKQFLVVKKGGVARARFLSAREAARLMGAPEGFALPGTPNDGYRAMGDAVALPVARFLGRAFLAGLAEAAYSGRGGADGPGGA